MSWLTYDFGYAWPWNYGHLLAAIPALTLLGSPGGATGRVG